MKTIRIGNKLVGKGQPVLVIVEIGSNWNRDLGTAKKMIDVIKEAGGDVAKFQIFHVEGFYPREAGRVDHLLAKQDGKTVFINDLVKKAEVADDVHKQLKAYCEEVGVMYLCSTPQSDMADYLDKMGVPAFKVASPETAKYPMIKHMAKTGKPLILSTGGSTFEETAESVKWVKDEGNENLILMQCVARYPADPFDSNLRVIKTFEEKFDVPTGMSDHSLDPLFVPLTAVAVGAKIIEKHFTLNRNQEGPDHAFAIEPHELKEMIKGIRAVEKVEGEEERLKLVKELTGRSDEEIERVLGTGEKVVFPNEEGNRRFTHQCIFATRPIKKGEIFTEENIDVFRPGLKEWGIEAKHWEEVLGSTAKRDIQPDQSLKWEDVK